MLQTLKEAILNRNGKTIFDEYAKKKFLSNVKRRLLVNITVLLMTERHGYNIPVSVKEEYAKAIVDMLPALKFLQE